MFRLVSLLCLCCGVHATSATTSAVVEPPRSPSSPRATLRAAAERKAARAHLFRATSGRNSGIDGPGKDDERKFIEVVKKKNSPRIDAEIPDLPENLADGARGASSTSSTSAAPGASGTSSQSENGGSASESGGNVASRPIAPTAQGRLEGKLLPRVGSKWEGLGEKVASGLVGGEEAGGLGLSLLVGKKLLPDHAAAKEDVKEEIIIYG